MTPARYDRRAIREEDCVSAAETDERASAVLAIAASATGSVPNAALLRRILPLIENIRVAIGLMMA